MKNDYSKCDCNWFGGISTVLNLISLLICSNHTWRTYAEKALCDGFSISFTLPHTYRLMPAGYGFDATQINWKRQKYAHSESEWFWCDLLEVFFSPNAIRYGGAKSLKAPNAAVNVLCISHFSHRNALIGRRRSIVKLKVCYHYYHWAPPTRLLLLFIIVNCMAHWQRRMHAANAYKWDDWEQ